jgi:hypothetical protein
VKRANKKRRGQCQANQHQALHDWLMRLPEDVLEHQELSQKPWASTTASA